MSKTTKQAQREVAMLRLGHLASQASTFLPSFLFDYVDDIAERVAEKLEKRLATNGSGSVVVDFDGLCKAMQWGKKHRNTKARWIREGKIPPPIETADGPRWIVEDVLEYYKVNGTATQS